MSYRYYIISYQKCVSRITRFRFLVYLCIKNEVLLVQRHSLHTSLSRSFAGHMPWCILSPTHKTHSHTCMWTQTQSALQSRRISHGLPGACLCCSECIATGNLTHHSTRGSLSISGKPMQPTARSNKPPFGKKETAPNTQLSYECHRQLRWLFKSSSCFSSSCWTGAKLPSPAMVSGV